LRYFTVRLLIVLAGIAWIGIGAGCGSPATERPARHDAASTTDSAPHRDAIVATDSTSVDAAAAVIREYYGAIQARDYRRAYRLWEGGGAASGQTYERFAVGFAGTARVAVALGKPGRMDAAAGSRYVEIPVTIRAVTRGGGEQVFEGSYVLRRSVVDGATEAQRRWHIYSAKIRAVS